MWTGQPVTAFNLVPPSPLLPFPRSFFMSYLLPRFHSSLHVFLPSMCHDLSLAGSHFFNCKLFILDHFNITILFHVFCLTSPFWILFFSLMSLYIFSFAFFLFFDSFLVITVTASHHRVSTSTPFVFPPFPLFYYRSPPCALLHSDIVTPLNGNHYFHQSDNRWRRRTEGDDMKPLFSPVSHAAHKVPLSRSRLTYVRNAWYVAASGLARFVSCVGV